MSLIGGRGRAAQPAAGRAWWLGLALIAVAAAAVSHLAYYALIWSALLRIPSLFGVDIIAFYAAGRVLQEGPPGALYDLERQAAIQAPIVGPDYIAGGVLPYNHPPFLAPLLALLVDGNYRASYVRWCLALVAALALAGLAARALLLGRGWGGAAATAAAVSAVLFYPVFNGVLKGQDAALVLLGAMVWVWALAQRQDGLAGAALALTVIKPQIALALAVPLLAARRWRALAWFAGVAGALTLLSVLLVGPRGVADYLGVLALSSQGVGYGFNPQAMYNLTGLVLRAEPGIAPGLLGAIRWGGFLLGVAAVCWLWWGRGERLALSHVSAAVCLALFLSPHLHFHDLGLLLLPLLAAAASLWARGGTWRAAALLLPALCSFALMAAEVLPGSRPFLASYALMLGLLAFALYDVRQAERATP